MAACGTYEEENELTKESPGKISDY